MVGAVLYFLHRNARMVILSVCGAGTILVCSLVLHILRNLHSA